MCACIRIMVNKYLFCQFVKSKNKTKQYLQRDGTIFVQSFQWTFIFYSKNQKNTFREKIFFPFLPFIELLSRLVLPPICPCFNTNAFSLLLNPSLRTGGSLLGYRYFLLIYIFFNICI